MADIPADVRTCAQNPTNWEQGKVLTVGEVQRLWMTDRKRLKESNKCLARLIELYDGTREALSGVAR